MMMVICAYPSYDLTAIGLKEALQFLFSGQFKLAPGNKEAVVHVGDGVFDQGVVFLGAEQKSTRCLVSIGHHVLAIPEHRGVELTEVPVGEFVHLEFLCGAHNYVADTAFIPFNIAFVRVLRHISWLQYIVESDCSCQFHKRMLGR
jgi:hypothetical protein